MYLVLASKTAGFSRRVRLKHRACKITPVDNYQQGLILHLWPIEDCINWTTVRGNATTIWFGRQSIAATCLGTD